MTLFSREVTVTLQGGELTSQENLEDPAVRLVERYQSAKSYFPNLEMSLG